MKVVPSPCLVACSSQTVKEVLCLMEESKSSYVVLVNATGELSGIFTKTDAIKLSCDLLESPEIGDKGIHLYMSRPVKTLSLGMVHAAPEFMIKNKFEHVPITEKDPESGQEQVVGIVTSEAIFEFMVKLRGLPPIFGGETVRRTRKTIGVLGADGSVFRLFQSVYSKSFYVSVERFRFSGFDLEKVAQDIDVLILDIDEVENRVWIPVVKSVLANPDLETVFLAYAPGGHEKILDGLKKMETSGFVRLYEKPLDLSKVTVDLEKLWVGM